MSWSNGSELMATIIDTMCENQVKADVRYAIYAKLIPEFEDYDCDTLFECVDLDTAFKSAYEDISSMSDNEDLDEDYYYDEISEEDS